MSGDPSGLGWQRPGISGPVEQEEDRLILKQQAHTLERGIVIPSDVVDSGGTPTTKLRKGFVLVRVEAAGALQGQFVQFGHVLSCRCTLHAQPWSVVAELQVQRLA